MIDCNGEWDGAYSYDTHAEWVSFRAVLRDHDGLLGGETIEDCEFLEFDGGPNTATLSGTRTGRTVRFTKIYDAHLVALDPIIYSGMLSEDGTEIAGRWSIPGDCTGVFTMRRPGSAEQTVERTAEVEL